jgi:2-iminobutanoate/2-iminopropanoate deaminase
MNHNSTTRRGFAARLASLFTGAGMAGLTWTTARPAEAQEPGGLQKLDDKGKPASRQGFITPVIVHGGVIYIAGQGAHSRGDNSDAGKTPTTEMHARMVMDNVKTCVVAGGGTMDSVLQLTVFLTNIDQYDDFNKVFKTYFPNGGPARTCVAVSALPGQSLVEVNCTAAVVNPEKKGA